MKFQWASIRVGIETRNLARRLSANAGMPIKDYMKVLLEQNENNEVQPSKKKKALRGFDFGF